MKQNDWLTVGLLALGGYVVYSTFVKKPAAEIPAVPSLPSPLGIAATVVPAIGTAAQDYFDFWFKAGQAAGKVITDTIIPPSQTAGTILSATSAKITAGLPDLAQTFKSLSYPAALPKAGTVTPATATTSKQVVSVASASGTLLRSGQTAYSYPIQGTIFKGGYWVK